MTQIITFAVTSFTKSGNTVAQKSMAKFFDKASPKCLKQIYFSPVKTYSKQANWFHDYWNME